VKFSQNFRRNGRILISRSNGLTQQMILLHESLLASATGT